MYHKPENRLELCICSQQHQNTISSPIFYSVNCFISHFKITFLIYFFSHLQNSQCNLLLYLKSCIKIMHPENMHDNKYLKKKNQHL